MHASNPWHQRGLSVVEWPVHCRPHPVASAGWLVVPCNLSDPGDQRVVARKETFGYITPPG